MERREILESVVKHLRSNVDGLSGRDIDPRLSMKDYGAQSLDMVEIVSAVMSELGIRVPRTEFADAKNIDEFVDLLMKFTK